MKIIKIPAAEILWKSNRFDLIFKYKTLVDSEGFAQNKSIYYENYIRHIQAFNNFFEEEPKKNSREDFLLSFKKTYESIKKLNFDAKLSYVTINHQMQLLDGAHRLAICAYLNETIYAKVEDGECEYNSDYFIKAGLPLSIADLHALYFIEKCPSITLGFLHSCVSKTEEVKISKLLKTKAPIFYKKEINLNFNGYVNFKKICYAPNSNEESWIGSEKNKYAGAKDHALSSFGPHPLRMYVFACKPEDLIPVKKEIRDILQKGNFSFHSSESKAEAVRLGEYFLNINTKRFYESYPFELEIENKLNKYLSIAKLLNSKVQSLDDICLSGSCVLDIFNIRSARDLDYITIKDQYKTIPGSPFSNHDSEKMYYPHFDALIYDPKNFLKLCGLKVLNLNNILQLKLKRKEFPKDFIDIIKILFFYLKSKYV